MVKDAPSACTAKCSRSCGSRSLAGQVDAAGVGATTGAALDRMHMPGTPQDRGTLVHPSIYGVQALAAALPNSDLLPQFEPGLNKRHHRPVTRGHIFGHDFLDGI